MNIEFNGICYYLVTDLTAAISNHSSSNIPVELTIYQCSEEEQENLLESVQSQPPLLGLRFIIKPLTKQNHSLQLLFDTSYCNYKEVQFFSYCTSLVDDADYYSTLRSTLTAQRIRYLLSSYIVKQQKITTLSSIENTVAPIVEEMATSLLKEAKNPPRPFNALGVLKEAISEQDIITPMLPIIETELPLLLAHLLPFGAENISLAIKIRYLKLKESFDFFYALEAPVDRQTILQSVLQIEEELKFFLKNIPLPLSLISMIIRYAITNETEQAAFLALLSEGSFMFLLNESLKKAFTKELNEIIDQLEPNAPSLNTLFLSCIGPFDSTDTTLDALTHYLQPVDSIHSFIERLFFIQQNDKEEYQRCLHLLCAPDHLEPLKVLIKNPNVLTGLLSSVSFSQQLGLIVHALRNHAKTANNLDKALSALKAIKTVEKQLPAEIIPFLINATLHYELSHSNHFPIQALIELQQFNINQQHNNLFKLLLDGIHKTSHQPALQELLVNTTFDAIHHYIGQEADFSSFIGLLLTSCTQYTASKLASYQALIKGIPQSPEKRAFWLKILAGLARQGADIAELDQIHHKLLHHHETWEDVALLFTTQPYPETDILLSFLNKSSSELLKFIHRYDKDPAQLRTTPEKITAQFSLSILPDRLDHVKIPLYAQRLSKEKQYEIMQQLTYINLLGHRFITQEITPLINKSRLELQQDFSQVVRSLRENNQSKESVQQQKLLLIALMRELFYRTTGHFPYSTQIMVLLLSLDQEHNLLFEIETGEGKSIITALLAVLQWVDGGVVGVGLAHQGLIQQDYEERKIRYFFDALEIPNTIIKSASLDFLVNGINYATAEEFLFYKIKNQLNPSDAVNTPIISHLILDECDAFLLDNTISFELILEQGNHFSWVYPYLNEFIDHVLKANTQYLRKEEIWQLKKYLLLTVSNQEQYQAIDSFSIQQLDQWLDAAYLAQQLKIDSHFIIQHPEIDELQAPVAEIIPLIKGVPQSGHTFSNNILHCLHARLQKTHPHLSFPIEWASNVVVSESTHHFIEYFKPGSLIGLTATAGTTEELAEQKNDWDMLCLTIPPYKKNNRQILNPMPYSSNKIWHAIHQFIDSLPQSAPGRQPILVITKDLEEASSLYQQLNKIYPGQVHLILNEEQQNQNQLRSGRPNQITVSTFLLGRGADIETKHKKGLLVIQTYIDSYRRTQQITGRCARNGRPGQYIAFYEAKDNIKYLHIDNLLFSDNKQAELTIKKLQSKIQQEASIQRYLFQKIDNIQKTILHHFDNWYLFILNISSTKQRLALKKECAKRRSTLISALNTHWTIQVARHHLPLEEDGLFSAVTFKKILKNYEMYDAIPLLNKEKSYFIALVESMNSLMPFHRLQFDFLKSIDIEHEVTIASYSKKHQALQTSPNRLKKTCSSFALNEERALLTYGHAQLAEEEKTKLKMISHKKELKSILNFYNKQIKKLHIKNKVICSYNYLNENSPAENLEQFTNQLNHIHSIPTTYRHLFYPIISACFSLSLSLDVRQKTKKDLRKLNNQFIHDGMDKIVQQIITECSWVERKGMDYYIERHAVRKAAQELLFLAKQIANKTLKSEKNTQIQLLYDVLKKQHSQVNNLWFYFSLGHKDIRKTTADCLNQCESLSHSGQFSLTKADNQVITQCLHQEQEQRLHYYLETIHGKNRIEKVIIQPAPNNLYSAYDIFIYKKTPYQPIDGYVDLVCTSKIESLKKQEMLLQQLKNQLNSIQTLSIEQEDIALLIKEKIKNNTIKAYLLHTSAQWRRAQDKLHELPEKVLPEPKNRVQMPGRQMKREDKNNTQQESIAAIQKQIKIIETEWDRLKKKAITHWIEDNELCLEKPVEEHSHWLDSQLHLIKEAIQSHTKQDMIAVKSCPSKEAFDDYLRHLEHQEFNILYANFANSYQPNSSKPSFFTSPFQTVKECITTMQTSFKKT